MALETLGTTGLGVFGGGAVRFRRAWGMTLVEVLAVVVILGLLAATLAAGFSGMFGKGKHELAKTGMSIVRQKVEAYWIEHSRYPSTDIGLELLSDGHATPSNAYYLQPDQLLDPWGRAYLFIVPGPSGHPYEIVTYGADGQPGGDDENADLSTAKLRSES